MEKRFKNKLIVTGHQSLLNEFSNKLEAIGYEVRCKDDSTCPFILINRGNHNGVALWNQDRSSYLDLKIYGLPHEGKIALELASETEEVIPEYVKITKGLGWYSDKVKKVYKLWQEDIDRSDFYEGKTMYIVEKEGQKSFYLIDKENCIPVTKEEYDKQQNSSKFKVGDFYLYDNRELRYIHKIEDGKYHYHQEIPRNSHSTVDCIERVDGMYDYRKVSDEEALELLKNHYAKQGVVKGARVTWGDQVYNLEILGFDLVENRKPNTRKQIGNSQLAIIVEQRYDVDTITPTTDNFKVFPKEVRVGGYLANIINGPADTEKIIKIGCQWYTRHSLITIRDMIIHGIDGRTSLNFRHSSAGIVNVTVNELNEAIKLFDQ